MTERRVSLFGRVLPGEEARREMNWILLDVADALDDARVDLHELRDLIDAQFRPNATS